MAVHRVFFAELAPDTADALIGGEEAHHAVRVKRLATGHPIVVLNGRGLEGTGTIAEITKNKHEWALRVRFDTVRQVPRVTPRLEVWTSTPKGPRLEDMIDGLSQVGAASWSPLTARRTVVEPGGNKLDRMHRLAAEASKQCGRAWQLEIGPGGGLQEAFTSPGGTPDAATSSSPIRVVIADASGSAYQATGTEPIRLLVGPEGGWDGPELDLMRQRSATIARFGPHVMRVETAAIVASGIVLDAEVRFRTEGGDRHE